MSSHHMQTSAWRSSSTPSPRSTAFGLGSTKETLTAYIERACDPSLHEPNMSLDLEIADLINQKKANTPREAAVEVVRLVNHRNTHVAMLALHLLDILVKNCGYPFHLQISTKDFLNELVRRFPERPPTFPPPPMAKVLELVHEWKNTICVTSKYKEDLVHIRDMHRLLSYKGYRFPDFDRRAASVLNPTENLQTPDELEEEDRAAQAAKLQELIRRGTPKDLAAAQELMKVMSGAEPEKKPDYEQQVQKELDRIQQRILLLNEMLNNAKPNERFADGDAYYQIAHKCRQVQPKLQKWIEENAENDPSAIDRLLLMNDLINNVVKRYEAFKKGDRTTVAEIDASFSSADSQSKAKAQAKQVSLIDFDFDEVAPVAGATPSAGASTEIDDLTALSSLSLGPSPSLSFGSSSGPPPPPPPKHIDPMSLFDLNPSSFSSAPSSTTAPAFSQPPPPQVQRQSSGSFFSNPAYGHATPNGGASRSALPSMALWPLLLVLLGLFATTDAQTPSCPSDTSPLTFDSTNYCCDYLPVDNTAYGAACTTTVTNGILTYLCVLMGAAGDQVILRTYDSDNNVFTEEVQPQYGPGAGAVIQGTLATREYGFGVDANGVPMGMVYVGTGGGRNGVSPGDYGYLSGNGGGFSSFGLYGTGIDPDTGDLRIVTAGGGGGAAYQKAGGAAGGFASGDVGKDGEGYGDYSDAASNSDTGGGGATQTAPGLGGGGQYVGNPGMGSTGGGGVGVDDCAGGGGGYYGGGGAGFDSAYQQPGLGYAGDGGGGGGGGGSSYVVGSLTNAAFDANAGSAQVTVSYTVTCSPLALEPTTASDRRRRSMLYLKKQKYLECIDFDELSSCGGCVSEGTGVDCLALPGYAGVSCIDDKCLGTSCLPGYQLNRRECVKKV
ncbi:VHS domain containing protein [Pseudohyphozyma bogoriensis]|nr:VHS domain containing protein [Pseudohyphozyma bogoriensis]